MKEEKLLTQTELELVNILWKIKEGSVADVIEHLPKNRDLAYTSVSTILRILEQKNILKTRKEGRGHIYIPLITKQQYEATTIKDVVERVFDGTPLAMAKQLLNTTKLNKEELNELKKMIEERELS